MEAPNTFCYDIISVCKKGKNCPRYFEYLSEGKGEFKLKISVYSADKTILGQGETILDVKKARPAKEKKCILCVDASETQGGQWASRETADFLRRAASRRDMAALAV